MSETTIRIDTRESDLASRVSFLLEGSDAVVPVLVEPLLVGDIIVASATAEIALERKTMADWCASIKDGRYREQRARLLEWKNGTVAGLVEEPRLQRHVVYVIEGFRASWQDLANDTRYKMERRGLAPSALVSSYLHFIFKYGFQVIPTAGLEDTARLVIEMAKRADDLGGEVKTGTTAETYLQECVKLKRSKNIEPTNVLLYQLSQIPGISIKLASAVQTEAHATMAALCRVLDAMGTTEERRDYLARLPVEGGKRSVGKKTAETIVSYMGF